MLRVFRNDYRNSAPQPRHAHAETTVTIVLGGTLRERVGSAEEIAGPLSYVIKPRDTEHANEFSPYVRTLQIVIPENEAAEFEEASHLLTRWRWHHGGPAIPAFLALTRGLRVSSNHSADPLSVDLDAIELLGALANVAETPSDVPPQWVSRIRETLDDSVDPPSVRALASAAGVHPVYLARQFRKWYGCSITEHARRLRVRRAAEAILQGRGTLSSASYVAGFADHPHMCRVFRRQTGLTPAAFRALVES